MTKGQKALEELKSFTLVTYDDEGNEEDCITLEQYDETMFYDIEKELKRLQELYNTIKQKRDNARLERDEHARKQDISDEEKSELRGEICAYNDILSLIESMFEVEKC